MGEYRSDLNPGAGQQMGRLTSGSFVEGHRPLEGPSARVLGVESKMG